MPSKPLLAIALLLIAGTARAGEPLQYNRDVRPILAENCFACHGPDSAARKAKLRLDDRDAAIEKGAITAGKLDESELVARLDLEASDEKRMPPASAHKELTAAQKATLKTWIEQGAAYEPHWAFIAPKRPALPKVSKPEWVRTPVDAFVLAELDRRKLAPAPEADRRTLARRAALDVTGLPPTPQQVQAFVDDKAPDAYEKYLDGLFASPHYGEHRARYWLDAARYGDTHGIHFDNYREVWAYRDWVINSFNANQPFDRFTTEQLAGDLLPKPTLDQLVATGFNRNHITTNEGGAINEEYLVLYTRDRTDAASTVFMGLTAACAVCHDHKFDPLSQKEFYSLAAFFNNTTQAAMDGNVKDTPPVVFVPAAEDRAAWLGLKAKLDAADAKLAARKVAGRAGFEQWLKAADPKALRRATAPEKAQLSLPLDEGKRGPVAAQFSGKPAALKTPAEAERKPGPFGGPALLLKPGTDTLSFPAVGDFEADEAFSYGAWVQVPNRGQTAAILARMDIADSHRGWDLWLDNDRFSAHFIHSWPEQAIKVTTRNTFNVNQWHHVYVTYDGSRKVAGVKLYVDGELQPLEVTANGKNDGSTATQAFAGRMKTAAPLTLGRRTTGQAFRSIALADVRVEAGVRSGPEVAQLALAGQVAGVLSKPVGKRSGAEADKLFTWWLGQHDAAYRQAVEAREALKQDEVATRARGTIAAVMNEKPTPPEAFILFRGEYDQRRDKVAAGTPKVLPPLGDLPANRLGLAKWLLRDDHPLTARVTVNRFWQELFGTGLVRTAGDFGITGEQPSHPELLDWLAVEFREGSTPVRGLAPAAWDVRRLFKLMLLSSAYRQSAATTPLKLEADPANRYVSRGPRFRLDAEVIRDAALAAAGLLIPKVGGASVRPYQPEGVWEAVAMKESNTGRYKADNGANLYRRSLYTFWKRSAPPASLEIFNAPNRETCTVRRDRTNTPLQALVTLNDVQFVEAARVLAEAALAKHATDDARLDFLAETLLARRFTAKERPIVSASLKLLAAHYAQAPAEAAKLVGVGEKPPAAGLKASEVAAWAMLANELMNLDEVLCK